MKDHVLTCRLFSRFFTAVRERSKTEMRNELGFRVPDRGFRGLGV